jgi:HPt (histidine-containing phosphotransfer) domain-containing protein
MTVEKGILDDFILEASELLDEAEDGLLKNSDKKDIKKIYDLVFRAFHSLKGSSGMIGFDELQRHLHLLEDYLQKSKNNFDHFLASTDYYLLGIDAARKILKGEVVHFVYEVYGSKKTKTVELEELKKRKILYLSNTKIKLLGEQILAQESVLDFSLTFITIDDLASGGLMKEEYDILISDLSLGLLQSLIPAKKAKLPLIHISDDISNDTKSDSIFLILKKSDELKRVYLTLKAALEIRASLEMYDRARGILMYMYSDLEEYLIEKNKLEIQKTISLEIKNFIKDYAR